MLLFGMRLLRLLVRVMLFVIPIVVAQMIPWLADPGPYDFETAFNGWLALVVAFLTLGVGVWLNMWFTDWSRGRPFWRRGLD